MIKRILKRMFSPCDRHYKLHFFLYLLTLFLVFVTFDAAGYELERQSSSMMKLLYFVIANFIAEFVVQLVIAIIDTRKS